MNNGMNQRMWMARKEKNGLVHLLERCGYDSEWEVIAAYRTWDFGPDSALACRIPFASYLLERFLKRVPLHAEVFDFATNALFIREQNETEFCESEMRVWHERIFPIRSKAREANSERKSYVKKRREKI